MSNLIGLNPDTDQPIHHGHFSLYQSPDGRIYTECAFSGEISLVDGVEVWDAGENVIARGAPTEASIWSLMVRFRSGLETKRLSLVCHYT